MKTIELTEEQLSFIESLILQYIKDRKRCAFESLHDKELRDFFLEHANKAKILYQKLAKQ